MSLLSNYEELRKQIEKLLRENESLKKLVTLIQENHDLKAAVKTQASAMGISGINNMFGEGTTGSASQATDRVNSPSAQVSTHDPDLDKLGILSSLAEILSNPQSNLLNSPPTSPTSSPLTGPLPQSQNNTVPGPVAVLTNYPLLTFLTGNLNNQLTGPKALSPNSILVNHLPGYMTPSNSLGIGSEIAPTQSSASEGPETGPLSDSSINPLTVSPLTGPTNIPLTMPSASNPQTGSMTASKTIPPTRKLSFLLPAPSSPPMMAPPITPMSSTLTGSISGPPGNSLPPSMVNNKLLTDSSRPQSPLDAPQRSSIPTTSANTPAFSARVSKGNRVIVSCDGNKIIMGWEPSSDEEPFNTFVDHPMQTSTPLGAITAGTPITTFFGTPETLAQGKTSIPVVSSALTSAPQISTSAFPATISPSRIQPIIATSSHHPNVLTSSPPTINTIIHQDTFKPHNKPQPSPRHISLTTNTSLFPSHPIPATYFSSSTNNAQGVHPSEPSNKNLQESERKMSHQRSGKLSDSSRDPKQMTWERLVGEIAFQLDRRILSIIFPERVRLYGFTISNIPEKIIQASLNISTNKLDEELCQTLTQRYVTIMNRLQSLGYNVQVHPGLTEQLVNAYGILRERPELAGSEDGNYSMDFLQKVVMETVPPSMLNDALLLLNCLNHLSHDDGKPMFIW